MAKQFLQASEGQNVSHESIARRAYEIWQTEGCPDGRDMEHWLRALSELKAQSNGTEREREEEASEPRTVRRPAPRIAQKRFQTAGR
jgi:hypothetical protein